MKKIVSVFFILSCFSIVAFNVKTSDNNLINQSTQQYDAALLQIISPVNGCDLGLEDVSVIVVNLGDTMLAGSLTVSYSANSASPVIETIGIPLFPGDTFVYTFSQPLNMVVNVDTVFELIAWLDLTGDINQTNDTITKAVISYFKPSDPLSVNQTVWFGNSANLTVSPIDSNLNYNWYDSIGGNLINTGTVYETPVLTDTTSYFVLATSSSFSTIIVGSGTYSLGTTSNNPYGQFYTSNNSQFLIKAEELIAAGCTAGSITSLALDVTTPTSATNNGDNMDNFSIKIGHTTISEIDTNWITGLTEVFFAPQWPTVAGWNVHEFQNPFQWDGVSNLMVEFCFSNGTSNYSSNAILRATDVGFQVGHGIYTDAVYTCGDPGAFPKTATTKRPNMKLQIFHPGCSTNLVEVTANVKYADYDVAVVEIISPVTAEYLEYEPVTVAIVNLGNFAIDNFPVSYTEAIGWPIFSQEIFSDTINPGDTAIFSFNIPAYFPSGETSYNLCVFTGLAADENSSNDTLCATIWQTGGPCLWPTQYGPINNQPVSGVTTSAGDQEWWKFTATTDYENVSVSLCGSTFDTKLAIYTDCSEAPLWNNDDNYAACSSSASQIDISNLPAGTYKVKVFGYSSYFGNYFLSITGTAVQTINLPALWSIFSTYIDPTSPNISDVLSEVQPNMIIAKDGLGQPYWPQYGVNLIGNLTPGWGYQIKMTNADTLLVEGNIIQPDTLTIQLPAQWSMLGYVRMSPAPIDQILLPIINNVSIVKNGNGQVYWPAYSVNLIGNMQPGQGYQIKMTSPQSFTYPANSVIFSTN
ncbi:MAG: pre-peptidase C-terminal domain-containing protein [Bacteroidales bacterium]|nr:pre-peptidase C-terminal domain-containing protein [Bacteroidales bacterium]MCF8456549.1 pre-peptidase C-terminal domain-containing protein [Bacteroidales bacterium]